jgi:rod shape determining protein RodA
MKSTTSFKNYNWPILLATMVPITFGLTMIYSVAPGLLSQQVLFVALGFSTLFLLSQTDYRVFSGLEGLLYGIIVFLLIFVLVLGTRVRGSVRWFELGNFRLQPSELVKPLLILVFAGVFTKANLALIRNFFLIVVLVFLPLLLIAKQPDFGSSFIILMTLMGMYLVSGLSLSPLIVSSTIVIFFFPVIWHFLRDYQKARLIAFFDPYADPLGAGYNVIQAGIAVGSGRVFGKGLGYGTQSHLKFLPEQHTDFIFATLAEELGLVGSLILIVAYFVLIWQILRIAKNASDLLGSLICVGVATQLFVQVFINIGMNIGLSPITGITLPLLSYGGSSLVSTMASLGLVQSVARKRRPPATIDIK